MTQPDSVPTVVAVIAAYGPLPTLIGTVRTLLDQVQEVVVVDDGSPEETEPLFNELASIGVTIVRQGTNSGIAAALNAGIEKARELWNPDFYLTLDQDSRPSPQYVRSGLETFTTAAALGLHVGFVTAASYSGHPIPVRASKGPFVQAFDPMQSGFLLPRSSFERVGRFDEGLFIDGVDSEYTMRTRSAGLSVLVGEGCDIEHDLGQREPATLFGKAVRIKGSQLSYNYHSPSRVYYICRNGTVLSLRYVVKDPAWVVRRLVEESKAHVLRFTFSPGRLKLAQAAAQGFRDAFRGSTGRIPARLEQRLRR